jgi:hypothetical protein
VTYRPDLSERALGQLGGFPSDALGALAGVMAAVCEDPYDPLLTMATDDPQVRRCDFGGHGFATYLIIDDVQVVRVVDIIWAG